MSRERIDLKYDAEKFQKLKDFIQDISRKDLNLSKAQTTEKALDIALFKMEEINQKREMKALEFKKVEQEIREVIE